MGRIGGIILAAGASRRMGRAKLLLPFRGRALISWVARAALEGGLAPVTAVLGPHSPPELEDILRLAPGIIPARVDSAVQEQSASLKAGLEALEGLAGADGGASLAGACVLLGDQPLVGPELVARLAGAARRRPGFFVAPRFNGRRGNPVIIPAAFFPEALRLCGDAGARGLLERGDAQVYLLDVEDNAAVFDIDAPEDYDALLRLERDDRA